jgi:ketosteroid isomerase-like protein
VSSNLELVRLIYAAWERGDFRSVDWADPKINYVVMDGPSPGSWTGVAEMAEVARDMLNAFQDWRDEAEEYRELPDGRVFVLDRLSGRGKASGIDVGHMRAHGVHVFDIREGKVTRLVYYNDRERALADLGLSPQGDAGPAG